MAEKPSTEFVARAPTRKPTCAIELKITSLFILFCLNAKKVPVKTEIIPTKTKKSLISTNNIDITETHLIKKLKIKIEKNDKSVKGFNIGTNSGKVAGQSVDHCHIHLIPRRKNDVKNPQGGVRAVISAKQHYVRKK